MKPSRFEIGFFERANPSNFILFLFVEVNLVRNLDKEYIHLNHDIVYIRESVKYKTEKFRYFRFCNKSFRK